jgi:hypothetical protein
MLAGDAAAGDARDQLAAADPHDRRALDLFDEPGGRSKLAVSDAHGHARADLGASRLDRRRVGGSVAQFTTLSGETSHGPPDAADPGDQTSR